MIDPKAPSNDPRAEAAENPVSMVHSDLARRIIPAALETPRRRAIDRRYETSLTGVMLLHNSPAAHVGRTGDQ
jgi:hypothetical protein